MVHLGVIGGAPGSLKGGAIWSSFKSITFKWLKYLMLRVFYHVSFLDSFSCRRYSVCKKDLRICLYFLLEKESNLFCCFV